MDSTTVTLSHTMLVEHPIMRLTRDSWWDTLLAQQGQGPMSPSSSSSTALPYGQRDMHPVPGIACPPHPDSSLAHTVSPGLTEWPGVRYAAGYCYWVWHRHSTCPEEHVRDGADTTVGLDHHPLCEVMFTAHTVVSPPAW